MIHFIFIGSSEIKRSNCNMRDLFRSNDRQTIDRDILKKYIRFLIHRKERLLTNRVEAITKNLHCLLS